MKSPWKYLVQLASLGRTVEEPQSPRETQTAKTDARPVAPAAESAPSVPTSDVADPTAEASNEGASNLDAATTDTDVVTADGSAIATVERSTTDDSALLQEPAHPSQPLPTKRLRRSRKTSVTNVAVTDAVECGDGSSGVVPPPMTFFDEVAGLDAEIRQLRRQLAEKLVLQNAQLKKMLERYDAS